MSMIISPYSHGMDGTWTPALLSTPPVMWFDNVSSVTDAGSGACSLWTDRSGNAYDLSQSVSAGRPLIVTSGLDGKRTIRFDGTDDSMVHNGTGKSLWTNASGGWILTVLKKSALDGSSTGRYVVSVSTATSGNNRLAMTLGSTAESLKNTFQLRTRRLDGDAISSLANSSELANTNFHVFLTTMDWSVGDGFLYFDGTQVASNTSLTSSGSTSNTTPFDQLRIGGQSNASLYANVEIAEIILGAGAIPAAADLRRLEGYAAHKWGLEANLPISHPYRYYAP